MVFSTVALGAALAAASTPPVRLDYDIERLTRPATQGQNAFNPDMSLVFNFGARLSDSMSPPARRAAMREIEWGIAADVDPFLRTEAYIAFARSLDGDEGEVEVEEAFGSYSNLGPGMDLRIGKLAAATGRVNRNHLDQLDFFEYPFLITEVMGEEGLRAPGASLSYLLPSSRFQEVTIEALVPDDGPLFSGSDTGKPVWVGHYRTFFDFSDAFSGQLGASYGTGPMDGGTSRIYGIDFVGKLRPQGTGRSLIVESELFWYQAGTPGSVQRQGHFVSLAYELSKRIWIGARYDDVQIPDGTDSLRSYTAGVTLKLTEFQLMRLEFQRLDWRAAPDRNQLVFQAQWMIGPHRAHKY